MIKSWASQTLFENGHAQSVSGDRLPIAILIIPQWLMAIVVNRGIGGQKHPDQQTRSLTIHFVHRVRRFRDTP
jgi:hypothetical protein